MIVKKKSEGILWTNKKDKQRIRYKVLGMA